MSPTKGNVCATNGETAANFVDDKPTVIESLLDVYEIEKILFFSETLSLEDMKLAGVHLKQEISWPSSTT